MTYHHNWFDDCDQRNPRVRFGNPVHVFNNYYSNIRDYAIASTEDAGVLVEGNYFENVEDPFHQGQADSGPVASSPATTRSSTPAPDRPAGAWRASRTPTTLEPSGGVKSSVIAGAGVGKIST